MAEFEPPSVYRLNMPLCLMAIFVLMATCIRVTFVTAPSHWSYVVMPTILLASLTICLSQTSTEMPLLNLTTVALLAALYILGTTAFAPIQTWHWSDQMNFVAFCITTVFLGFEQTTRGQGMRDEPHQL